MKNIDYNNFSFKIARNSIEHFKKIKNENEEQWINDLENFTLLSYKTNTNLPNAEPNEKIIHLNKNLSECNIKL